LSDVIRIDSLDDPRVAAYRDVANPARLFEQSLFVAEGRLVVRRLLDLGQWRIESILLTQPAAHSLEDVLDATDAPAYLVDQVLMNAIAGFNIHRGCLALVERPAARTLSAADLLGADRLLVLEGVNNPDNVGGLFRAGAALGVGLVVRGPRCGDPLYRKAIRTSMGATLSLPWRQAAAWPAALADLRRAGLTLVACTPALDAPSLYDVDLPRRAAVLVGAEGPGLSAEALTDADLRVRIPMHGGVDSLNVTTAAAIVLSAVDARHRVAARPR
jgi:tRNA G18 (ribose-2'-O)-methylase SpoU